MPFLSESGSWTGQADLAAFLNNVWLPFARDDVKWADNQAPTRSPEVASPEAEIWTHRVARVGSPGADVSPFTPEAPYIQLRTDDTGDHLHIFSSYGVDTGQDAFDQPNNPMNCPQNADFSLNASVGTCRSLLVNDLVGSFSAYWMFADASGRYVHCVLKVAERQYRHFHVGLLTPLHPDLDAEAFYVTGHFWDQLDPGGLSSTPSGSAPITNNEHAPYASQHYMPFWNHIDGNELTPTSAVYSQLGGGLYYMPGLAQNSPEIVWYRPHSRNILTINEEISVQKAIGDVNNAADAVIFGRCHVSGHPSGLGAILYNADRTFTSNAVPLIPIYVSANIDFLSAIRSGVAAQVPDVFRINMKNIAAEAEITVGTDTYVCFPLINKDNANVLAGEGYSGYEGLAYKKITETVDV